jgi:hypothetical protein|tara:strand:+ start:111 stop:524 length:414 start_codon:yes stop_codon:yes gene_type:complete
MKKRECISELEEMMFIIGEGIYSIECLENNKIYFGNTNDFRSRYQKHLWCLRNNEHPNKELQKDYLIYGEESFRYRMLIPTTSKQDRHYLEWLLIDKTIQEGVGIYNVRVPIKDKYTGLNIALLEEIIEAIYLEEAA